MFSIVVCFGPNGEKWGFAFKTKETADTVYQNVKKVAYRTRPSNETPVLDITDDYGQRALIVTPIHGVLYEDVDLSSEAAVERGLANARTQAKANQRAAGDPTLRAGIQMPHSPFMMPPGRG